jgi:hypothetical protein
MPEDLAENHIETWARLAVLDLISSVQIEAYDGR